MLSPPRSSPRILLVDSGLPVVRVLASFLDPYTVEIATSGASALARLAALPPVDLVLCDLLLDDLDGRDLYRQACASAPDLRERFVFMTGERSSRPHDVDGFRVRVLARPFDPDVLLVLLQDVLTSLPPRAEA